MDEVGASLRYQVFTQTGSAARAAAFTSSNYSNAALLRLLARVALPPSPPLYISLIIVSPHVEMPVSTPPQPPTVSVTALCKAVNLAQQFTSPPTVCPYFWIC